ncbi:MAG TPA: ABC transporter permease [Candidatus Dormibacteraeota bacterium]|nr:ABC transporter permease [Candidatus Dormibacteraeota bacterium]
MKSLTRGHIKIAVTNLRSNRLRSLLTMLGVIIGVTSVISVVSIGQGIKHQIGDQINRLGKNVIIIRPLQLGAGQTGSALPLLSGFSVTSGLNDQDYKAVSSTTGVKMAVPLSLVAGATKGDNTSQTSVVVGTSDNFPSLVNQSLAEGVFFSSDENSLNVAVLGQNAANALFNENVPLGRSFTFRGQQFVVRGIFNQFTYTPLSNDINYNDAIFIPYDMAQGLTNNNSPIYEILAQSDSVHSVDQTSSQINQNLIKLHNGQPDFSVLKGYQDLSSANKILKLITRLISGVAAIAMLVGGVGIMNVMLVSVTERMQEIGIRKAVGATDRQILNQFMTEAAVLSLAGGLAGVILSLIINLVLRILTNLQPTINWQIIALSSAISIAVGIIFGSVPAIKASRKDPINALRNE